MGKIPEGFQVFFDRLLVQPIDPPERTPSGLYLPPSSYGKLRWGIVALTGTETYPDGNKHVSPVKVSDKVLFNPFAGTEIEVGDEKYIVIREAEVVICERVTTVPA